MISLQNIETLRKLCFRANGSREPSAQSFGQKTVHSITFGNFARISEALPSYFLKLALPFISGSLAHLFNIAIETSTFPDSWKIARVTPIFKEGEKCERSNYRPISVLPVIARLFEKLVFDQLYQYLD